MELKKHKLTGDDIIWQETPNTKGPFKEGLPDTIIIHYTAGASGQSSANTLSKEGGVSAHVVVDREGPVFQLAPFNIMCKHAGTSEYEGRKYFNQYAIGIEIDNAGFLEKNGDVYTSWFKRVYKPEDVVEATHRNESFPRYWHTFSEIQISKVEEICRLIMREYDIKYILGHEEISPGRKQDPGPAFPLDQLREQLFAGVLHEEEPIKPIPESGLIAVNKLNIRSAPEGEKVANALPRGQRVVILEEKDGWYKVKTEIEGWVSAKYVK